MPVSHDEHENDRGPSARMDLGLFLCIDATFKLPSPVSRYNVNMLNPNWEKKAVYFRSTLFQEDPKALDFLWWKQTLHGCPTLVWFPNPLFPGSGSDIQIHVRWGTRIPHLTKLLCWNFFCLDSCQIHYPCIEGKRKHPAQQLFFLMSNTLSPFQKNTAQPPWLPYLTQLLAPASVISSSPPTLALALLNLDSWTPGLHLPSS